MSFMWCTMKNNGQCIQGGPKKKVEGFGESASQKICPKKVGLIEEIRQNKQRNNCVNLLWRTQNNYVTNISMSSLTYNKKFCETVKPFSSGNLLKIAYLVDHETISLAKLGRNLLPLTDESLTVKKSTLIF